MVWSATSSASSLSPPMVVWPSVSPCVVSVSVDGAWNPTSSKAAIGVVARCSMRNFLAGMCRPVVFGSSTLETEASVAITCGYSQASLRTDSATLARVLNNIGNLGQGGGLSPSW